MVNNSNNNLSPQTNTIKRPRHMALEIQVLYCDRHILWQVMPVYIIYWCLNTKIGSKEVQFHSNFFCDGNVQLYHKLTFLNDHIKTHTYILPPNNLIFNVTTIAPTQYITKTSANCGPPSKLAFEPSPCDPSNILKCTQKYINVTPC